MRIANAPILDGYSQSSGSVNSSPFWIGHFSGYSVSVTVTNQSSYGATAKLQGCNDDGRDSTGSSGLDNWVDLPNSGATANLTLAANGTQLWNVDGAFYKWIRVVSTWSAGSATLDIRANGKGSQ